MIILGKYINLLLFIYKRRQAVMQNKKSGSRISGIRLVKINSAAKVVIKSNKVNVSFLITVFIVYYMMVSFAY